MAPKVSFNFNLLLICYCKRSIKTLHELRLRCLYISDRKGKKCHRERRDKSESLPTQIPKVLKSFLEGYHITLKLRQAFHIVLYYVTGTCFLTRGVPSPNKSVQNPWFFPLRTTVKNSSSHMASTITEWLPNLVMSPSSEFLSKWYLHANVPSI